MKKYLFIIMGVLSFFFFNDSVNAFVVKDYDSRLSLFDGLENYIPKCEDDYGNYCNKGTEASISKLVNDYPYIIRYTITINSTNKKYYIFGFYNDERLNYLYRNYNSGYIESPFFTISMLPEVGTDESFDSAFNSYPFILGAFKPGDIYDTTTYIRRNTAWQSNGVASFWRYFYNYQNSNYSISIDTNFNLDLENFNYNYVYGHQFDTDIDISVPKDNYLLLVPKKNSEFSSYLWTDNNFAYIESYYDKHNSTYSTIDGGGFNQINFASLGGFNWFRWEFSFNDLDLSFNKVLILYNHGSSNLNVKLFSSDFYYRLMDSNSSSFCANNICYSNNYDDNKNYAYSTGTIKNKYDTEDYDNGMSFIKNIPNLLKDFVKSFAFIGTLFTSAFTIFEGSIANYFYIIFGLSIIILIFKILR